jgi:chemotaxis protein methyltransferase CheR
MTTQLSKNALARLSRFISENIGIRFPRSRWNDLDRIIVSASDANRFDNPELYVDRLFTLSDEMIVDTLAQILTIGETYFFRDPQAFQTLETIILPELIRLRRGKSNYLRFWSAGCSTGEEVYSIAMTVDKLIPIKNEWDIFILGSDINRNFLQKALDGKYREWSFRGVPTSTKNLYFTKTDDNCYCVIPRIKQMANFSTLNLVFPINFFGMDVIFCRNVLMYFDRASQNRAIQQLYNGLADQGWLIISPSESMLLQGSKFKPVLLDNVTVYRKDENKSYFIANPTLQTKSLLWFTNKPTTLNEQEAVLKPNRQSVLDDVNPLESDFCSPLLTDESTYLSEQETIIEPERQSVINDVSWLEYEKISTDDNLRSEDPYDKALKFYKQGAIETARLKLKELLSHHQDHVQAMTLLARIYANQGNLVEAVQLCRRAILFDGLNPYAHYLLGAILQEQGEIEQAKQSFCRSLYLDPDYVLTHVSLGAVARKQKNFTKAEKYFDNATTLLRALDPKDIIPESDGLSVGRLIQIIDSLNAKNYE